MTERPRAVRLGEAGKVDHDPTAITDLVVPETEPVEPVAEPAAVPPKPTGFGWGSLFVAALGGLLTLSAGVWAERTITALMAQNPALGTIALGLAGLAGIALIVMLGRIARDIWRERRIEGLRERAVAVLAGGTLAEAQAIAKDVTALYAGRAETAKGRADLAEALPQLFAPSDVLAVAERSLLAPLDQQAQAQIASASRRVSLVTAVSPRAAIDVIFVLVACARLLRAIAGTYGGRPGTVGLIRLARQVMSHLVVTGGIAAGDAVIQQVVGQGLAARLSAKLGEGVLNGLLTARIGLSALAVCRPLPFVESKPPGLGDVAGDLTAWRGPS